MIDWNNVTFDDFKIRVEGESVEESGHSLIFPVHVYHKDGTKAFVKSVSIRAEFYAALKKTEGWQSALMKIFNQRVRDDLVQRMKPQVMPIADKIDFINTDEQPI